MPYLRNRSKAEKIKHFFFFQAVLFSYPKWPLEDGFRGVCSGPRPMSLGGWWQWDNKEEASLFFPDLFMWLLLGSLSILPPFVFFSSVEAGFHSSLSRSGIYLVLWILLLVNNNSSGRVGRKRNRMVFPAMHQAAVLKAGPSCPWPMCEGWKSAKPRPGGQT